MTKQEESKIRCNYTYHMDDPWYMIFCDKTKGHKGLHRFQWEKDRD